MEGRVTEVTSADSSPGTVVTFESCGRSHLPGERLRQGAEVSANPDTVNAALHLWGWNRNGHWEAFRQLLLSFTFPLHLPSCFPDLSFSVFPIAIRCW